MVSDIFHNCSSKENILKALKNEFSKFLKSVAIYFPMDFVKDHAHNTNQMHSIQFSGKYLYRTQFILCAVIVYHSFLCDNLGGKKISSFIYIYTVCGAMSIV
jgi:hypothetical protein